MILFCDGCVIEVYLNDRFALSTMIYTTDKNALGVSLFAEGSISAAIFSDVKCWAEMKSMLHT